MELPLSLIELFVFVGTPVFLGIVQSQILGNWDWFKALESGQKTVILTGVSILLAIVSYVGLNVIPPDLLARFDPFWKALAPLLNWVFNQSAGLLYHSTVSVRRERASGAKELGFDDANLSPEQKAKLFAQGLELQKKIASGDIKFRYAQQQLNA